MAYGFRERGDARPRLRDSTEPFNPNPRCETAEHAKAMTRSRHGRDFVLQDYKTRRHRYPGGLPPNAKIVGIAWPTPTNPWPASRSTVRRERVRPPERRKPREVAICRTNRGAMLKSDGSEDRVHDKRAGGLAVAHKTAQDVPVPLARLENPGGWLGEPRGNRRFGLGRVERALEYPRICSNSQKGPQREPSEADKIGLREHSFEPGSAFLVLLGSRMIGVEEQVRVDQDQR